LKTIKVFINGFGRIGRQCAKIISGMDMFELVGINDLYDKEQMHYLYCNDSIYGKSNPKDLDHVQFFNQKDPSNLCIESLEIDVVLQSSGIFVTTQSNTIFLDKGAKKVIITAPCSDDTPTFIQGINEHTYQNNNIISASSCSANAIIPIFDLIHRHLTLLSGSISMIHSYTSDQNLLDVKHPAKDIRRSRSATQNILPLQSSAVYAVSKIMPFLEGKLTATSIRVPLSHCTFYDFVMNVQKDTDLSTLKKILSQHNLMILDSTSKPCVSSDFIQNTYSATVDLNFTQVIDKNFIQVAAWQDNEYGYAKRIIELAQEIMKN